MSLKLTWGKFIYLCLLFGEIYSTSAENHQAKQLYQLKEYSPLWDKCCPPIRIWAGGRGVFSRFPPYWNMPMDIPDGGGGNQGPPISNNLVARLSPQGIPPSRVIYGHVSAETMGVVGKNHPVFSEALGGSQEKSPPPRGWDFS